MTTVEAVLLPVGAELYAAPMQWVREVVAAPLVTPLATAPPAVLGLFNLRGEIVPLFDTCALLGVGTVGPVTFAAILQTPHGLAGLAATDFPQRALLDTPTGPSELSGTTGVYRIDRRAAVLLDLAILLTPDRFGAREPADPALALGAA
jgi:chemotaxis signal transduction protein